MEQLPAFHASVIDQSPENQVTSPSSFDPSSLHIGRDHVITIQFHPCVSGHTHFHGLFQYVLAVAPKQIAVP